MKVPSLSSLCDLTERYLFIISSSSFPSYSLSLRPPLSYSRQMQCSAALERGKSLAYFSLGLSACHSEHHILTQSPAIKMRSHSPIHRTVTGAKGNTTKSRMQTVASLKSRVYRKYPEKLIPCQNVLLGGWLSQSRVAAATVGLSFPSSVFAAVLSAFCQIAGGRDNNEKKRGKHKEGRLDEGKGLITSPPDPTAQKGASIYDVYSLGVIRDLFHNILPFYIVWLKAHRHVLHSYIWHGSDGNCGTCSGVQFSKRRPSMIPRLCT